MYINRTFSLYAISMFRRTLLALFIGLLSFGNLPAQWNLINPLPTNENLTDMIFLTPLKGLAVGLNGTILSTANGGDSWKVNPTHSFTKLNSIASPDSSAVFICGDAGLLFRTDFSLTRIDTLDIGDCGNLNKIFFLNRKVGFCIGNDGLILKTSDAGTHWTRSVFDYPGNLLDLSFPDDSTGFITGRYYVPFSAYSATIIRTRDQGKSWHLVDSLMYDVEAICFTDSLTGYLGSFNIMKTSDGGKSWNNNSVQNSYFTDICFLSKQTGWAISYSGHLLKTTDGGVQWNRIARNGSANHIFKLNADTLSTYGAGGDIWLSRDGGERWSRRGSGDRNALSEITFTDKRFGYILGDSVYYRTTDAGSHWQIGTHPAGNVDDAAFADRDHCLMLTWNGTWLTGNGCKTWHKVDVSLPMAVFGCAFANTRTAYISGVNYGHFFYDPVLLKSGDGGETWSRDSLPGNVLVRKFYFRDDGTGFGMGFSGGLYRTSDTGHSWEQIAGIPEQVSFRNMTFPTRKTGYAIGVYTAITGANYNVICKTVDAGYTWTNIYQEDSMFRPEFSGLYFTDESTGYITSSAGFILKTTDGGTTWTRDFLTNGLNAIGGTGERIWVVGGYGSILSNIADSGIGSPDSTDQENLIRTVVPNPFQTHTDIGLMLDQEGAVNITVTDLAGRRLDDFNLIFPGGESFWTYDGTKLRSGIYILTVNSGKTVNSVRLLKVDRD